MFTTAVLLHEYAHIAAGPDEGHGARWRALFVLAASEVAGVRIEVDGNLERRAFHDAIQAKIAAHLYGRK